MSFYKKVPGKKTTLESTLKFDLAPTAGSTNPVTSGGVAKALGEVVGGASDALQEQIDDIAEKAGSGYTPKGPASVAILNGLTGQENGWLYTMTDAGTLTDGSLAVVAGDTVAWDATNSVWYKAMDYATKEFVQSISFSSLDNIYNTSIYSSYDELPVNSACCVSTHLDAEPDGHAGTCITFGSKNASQYSGQIFSSVSGKFFFRSKYLNVWSAWKEISDKSDIDDIRIALAEIEAAIDMNTQKQNVVVYSDSNYIKSNGSVGSNAVFSYTNKIVLPAGKAVAITCKGYSSNVAIISEVVTEHTSYTPLVVSSGNDLKTYVYRNISGADKNIAFSFSNSHEVTHVDVFKIVESNGLAIPSFGTFESFGVVGDSYASGVIYLGGDSQGANYGISWPQLIARNIGASCYNYSYGGATTLSFLTNSQRGLPKLVADSPMDAYIIALQINDQAGVGEKTGDEWLGSVEDIDINDSSNNSESFCGCYGSIISAILQHAPNSKIILMKKVTSSSLTASYNAAIDDIAALFHLPVISQDDDVVFSDTIYTSMSGGHPTRMGYSAMARGIQRLLDKCMSAYRAYFNA